MSIDDLKSLMDAFDPASLLPDVAEILDFLTAAVRLAVVAGPVLLLLAGLAYLFLAPKEANYHFGYRCFYGMGSVEAWRYSQKMAGLIWTGLGLVLTVVMAILCGNIGGPDLMDVLVEAMIWIGSQGIALVVACIAIDIAVVCVFDRRGFRRKEYK